MAAMERSNNPNDRRSIGSGDETSLHVRRVVDGDRTSLAWLVERFTPLLVLQAEHRLPKSMRSLYEPDDVVADVWCSCLGKIHDIAPHDGSYAMAVLKYLSTALLNRLRRLAERRIAGLPPETLAGAAPGDDATLSQISDDVTGVVTRIIRGETKNELRKMIDELDPEDREIVLWIGIEQRPQAEIAAKLGTRPKLVSQRYRRAVARLRDRCPHSAMADLCELAPDPGDGSDVD